MVCVLNGIRYQVKLNNFVYSELYSLEDNSVDLWMNVVIYGIFCKLHTYRHLVLFPWLNAYIHLWQWHYQRNRNESGDWMKYKSGDFFTTPKAPLLVHVFKELQEPRPKSVATYFRQNSKMWWFEMVNRLTDMLFYYRTMGNTLGQSSRNVEELRQEPI